MACLGYHTRIVFIYRHTVHIHSHRMHARAHAHVTNYNNGA